MQIIWRIQISNKQMSNNNKKKREDMNEEHDKEERKGQRCQIRSSTDNILFPDAHSHSYSRWLTFENYDNRDLSNSPKPKNLKQR